ncbi:MAG: hypothetical protein KBG28_13195 [Kofleriaceae bacterium]|nr:hypothetical protein [Kofleriaceae bacterium]
MSAPPSRPGPRIAPTALVLALVLGGLAACPGPDGDPKRSANRLELAKEFLRKGELEAAEAEANKAIAYLASNEEAYWVRGLTAVSRALNATRLLEIDACLTGVDADALSEERDEHLGKARADFTKAVTLAPDFGDAWSNLGVVDNLLTAHDLAIEHLGQALANAVRLTNPGLTRAHLGWAFFSRGDYVKAAKELRQAVQFQPGMCVATYRLGRVYFAREEWENAAEQFATVSAQPDCGSQEASYYLMKTKLQLGDQEGARSARDACVARAGGSCLAAQCRSLLP